MKDDRLEKEFGEYFKGLTPPERITDAAKAAASEKKRAKTPSYVKFICVAASFVVCFLVAFSVLVTSLMGSFLKDSSESPSGSTSGADASSGEDENNTVQSYTAYESVDAYHAAQLHPSLKIIETLAYASNAQVLSCTAYYLEEQLAMVDAEVSLLNDGVRDDTQMVFEFSEEIYEPLADYHMGDVGYYSGAVYYLTEETAENGEPLFKLYVEYGGVKYYVRVQSSDEESYFKYLDMIVG